MTDESTLNQGGSEALPSADTTTQAAPRSDAEASLQKGTTAQPQDAAQQAEREAADRKKNRTKEYIERLQAENARLKSQNGGAQSDKGISAPASDKEPTPEDHDWDMAAFNKAHAKWSVDQALKERDQSTKQAEDGRRQQEVAAKYQQRAAEFADQHEDFIETVGSIPYQLSPEVQAAIMGHERGPEIAYHLGNNDDDAFNMSNVLPHVAAAAVERLAKRLTAAPQKPETPAAATNQLAAQPTKPVTKAPQPTATVSGRSPTETPPEKMTDEQWLERERAKRRKS